MQNFIMSLLEDNINNIWGKFFFGKSLRQNQSSIVSLIVFLILVMIHKIKRDQRICMIFLIMNDYSNGIDIFVTKRNDIL